MEKDQKTIAATGLAPRDLVKRFASLGDNCEFGFVQRHFGAEPIDIFRWANPSAQQILRALERNLDDLGSSIEVFLTDSNPRREWQVRDSEYGFVQHTTVLEGDMPEKAIKDQSKNKFLYLRRKLIEDLSCGNKIFVIKSIPNVSETDAISISKLLQARGPNWLLWVVVDENPGRCEIISEGLIKGSIDKLILGAPYFDNISFEIWLELMVGAWQIVSARERLKSYRQYGPSDLIEYLKHLLIDMPEDAVLRFDLGLALVNAYRFEEAIEVLTPATDAGTGLVNAHQLLYHSLAMSGRQDAAVEALNRAILLWPKNAELYRSLGHALGAMNKSLAAADSFRKALEITPEDSKLRLELGRALFHGDQFEEAVLQIQWALTESPELVDAHHLLARALFKSGKQKESIDILNEQIIRRPDDVELYLSLGHFLSYMGEIDAVVELLRKATEFMPDNLTLRLELGRALFHASRLDEALIIIRSLSEMAPELLEVQLLLTHVLANNGQQELAVQALNRAILLQPENADLYNFLGQLLAGMDNRHAAAEAFRKAVDLNPSRQEYRHSLEVVENSISVID